MYSVIPNYKKYILIIRRKNKSFYSKEDLILAIDKLYSDSKIKIMNFLIILPILTIIFLINS